MHPAEPPQVPFGLPSGSTDWERWRWRGNPQGSTQPHTQCWVMHCQAHEKQAHCAPPFQLVVTDGPLPNYLPACCWVWVQVDLADSCVLTLSGAWQGQLGWDGWGVPGSSGGSALRELVEAAVDRVRWWAEQCDRMQGGHAHTGCTCSSGVVAMVRRLWLPCLEMCAAHKSISSGKVGGY